MDLTVYYILFWPFLKGQRKRAVVLPLTGLQVRLSKASNNLEFIRYPLVVDLEKAVARHSSTLAWKIPWTEEPGGLQSTGSLGVGQTERLPFLFPLSCIGERNGNPLQYSCLENPRDGGAWWAAVYRVSQSRTRRKRLSSSSKPIVVNQGHE